MAKRKLLTSALILTASLLFGGCLVAKPADIRTESPDVTLSGTITQTGNLFKLTISEGQLVELDSRQVDLATYTGKTVTLTGQYSGTTLFVSKIE